MPKLYLGLDASTQSLSSVLIDPSTSSVVHEATVSFDADLPHYGTTNGVLHGPGEGEVHSPPQLWVEALDLLLTRLRDDGAPLDQVAMIAGSGQQHGSVYLKTGWSERLSALTGDRPLAEQLEGAYSRATSPVWMDHSTGAECEAIRIALGGQLTAAALTGSDIIERFTGPQIRKFALGDPEGWKHTESVALVSSFLASLLAGQVAPIDHGDGAGMNLMDIHQRTWSNGAVEATAPGLTGRLPDLASADTVIGPLAAWACQRYGFSPECRTAVWSGDNPCSVTGTGLVAPGMTAISLGTSDTFFGLLAECHTDPRGEGHVFVAPNGDYMSLICFRNGSLARERVRDTHELDWNGFSQALRDTPPGNDGALMLPWFEAELVPHVTRAGARRKGYEATDAARDCRAVVEGQMLAMRSFSAWMGKRPSSIRVTGGASANKEILQVMANVFSCPIQFAPSGAGAALGAALRARHADSGGAWEETVAGFTDTADERTVHPQPETTDVYDRMLDAWRAFADQELA